MGAARGLIWLAIVLSTCLLSAPALAGQAVFRLHLPPQVAPETATLVMGDGGGGGSEKLVAGKRDYEFPLYGKGATVSLLLYCPGYRMVTGHFSAAAAAAGFTPQLERLPTAPLRLRLVDSRGRPLAGERCSLRVDLAAHSYFGYVDGYVYFATVASGVTGRGGIWSVRVPVLSDDPYFAAHANPAALSLELILPDRDHRDPTADYTPAFIPVRRQYRNPVTVTVVNRARLHGRVPIAAVRTRGLHGTVTPYTYENQYTKIGPTRVELRAELGKVGPSYNCMLLRDGTFSQMLPPGTYDLTLVEIGRTIGPIKRVLYQSGRSMGGESYLKRVPLGIRIVLKEGEDRLVTVK